MSTWPEADAIALAHRDEMRVLAMELSETLLACSEEIAEFRPQP